MSPFLIYIAAASGGHSRDGANVAISTTPNGWRTRGRILEAAGRFFARAGYVTLRMGDVSAGAGVSMAAHKDRR